MVSYGEVSIKTSIRMPGIELIVTQGDLVVLWVYENYEKSAES